MEQTNGEGFCSAILSALMWYSCVMKQVKLLCVYIAITSKTDHKIIIETRLLLEFFFSSDYIEIEEII